MHEPIHYNIRTTCTFDCLSATTTLKIYLITSGINLLWELKNEFVGYAEGLAYLCIIILYKTGSLSFKVYL